MKLSLVFAAALVGACGSTSNETPPPQPEAGPDAAAPTMGVNGGTQDSLFFSVVGDTRPPNEDETSNYPTAIITKIFADVAAMSPMPPFVVSTGDYQYSNPTGSQANAQVNLYLGARGSYTGIQFPAMGNHECTGATASNCGTGNENGLTNNYNAFMSLMLAPLQKTLPYYVIHVASTSGAWTSKFVFVAANAWDSTQSTWFDTAMQEQTTYTFVVRHEAVDANTAPGVTPSEAIMAKYPYTLAIVGHSHEYSHTSENPKAVIIGNGGAPISSGQNYGYGVFTQRTDGSIQVDMMDYETNAPDMSFRFAVKADGTPAD